MVTRRNFVALGTGAFVTTLMGPRMAFARAATERRFVFIIQRGAADGLGIVAPVGDPAYAPARGDLAADFASAPRLDAMFALHPALATLHGMYGAGEALFAHAVASPYRDRSHFDGQNVLETGGTGPYVRKDGWLNRLAGMLPANDRAIALATTIPMALRGATEVSSYAPSALPDANDDLMRRVSALYEGDAQLHALWSEALATRMLANEDADHGRRAASNGTLAARLLAPADGARIAMIETGGWDTHAGQRGRLATQLRALDAMLGALRDGLGPLWRETLVLVATEFGRTVRANGTQGTDHGTGSLAMLAGGAVHGGRVVADWPGLADAQLYEGRDLRPTLALDGLIGGALADHFGLPAARVATTLFGGVPAARPLSGLIRA